MPAYRWRQPPPAAHADSIARGDWKKGMLVRGGIGVVALGFAYEVGRRTGESSGGFNPLGALVLVGVCALLGGLIGSFF